MSNSYQIVDEEDNLIGHKKREEIDPQKDIYRIGALWLTNESGEILIAQRVLTKDKDPGKWGPAAAGTMEEGETYESNIYKEAEEEIGLTGVKLKIGPSQRFRHPRQAFCQWYTAVCDWPECRFVLQADEVAKVKWIGPKELREDVENFPEKYVPGMKSEIDLFNI